jgi:pyruvate/2-oxoglutarate dehydrogenase complex dihydrolipoamide acyltransferase (E2) component
VEFRLPDIGEGLTEAEIVKWLVPVGGVVEVDAPLVEVETDKAVVEIPSPFGGTVLAHGAEEGATIQVGEVLAVIGDSSDMPNGKEAPPIVGTLDTASERLPTRSDSTPHARLPEGRSPGTGPRGSVKALPVVRKLARELGVDLAAVVGTGSDGTITRVDVRRAAGSSDKVAPREADERVTMSRLRRTIAAHMERSWREIPHVTTFDQVDGSRLLAARTALVRRLERQIPIETLVILAVLPVLRRFPEFNATLDDDDLVLHRRYDIGLAVDTPEGLIVPVVKRADQLDLMGLSAEVERLSGAARERTLVPDEIVGATFTVSNIGALGGGFGTPIIPYGTTAILSVGRSADSPIVRDGRVVVTQMVPLSLSYDHRVVDGGLGRRFMTMLMENLEEPALFLT